MWKLFLIYFVSMIFLHGCNLNQDENSESIFLLQKKYLKNLMKHKYCLKPLPVVALFDKSDDSFNEILDLDVTNILENIEKLCLSPRQYGTEGEKRVADYITELLQSYGYKTENQVFPCYKKDLSSEFEFEFFQLNPYNSDVLGYGMNIFAYKPSDTLSEKTLVLSAHYDTIATSVGAVDNAFRRLSCAGDSKSFAKL